MAGKINTNPNVKDGYLELSSSQIKAYRKLASNNVLDLLVEEGRFDVNRCSHLGRFRGADAVRYIQRELGILLGDGMSRESAFSKTRWVSMNKPTYLELDETYKTKLSQIHEYIKDGKYKELIPRKVEESTVKDIIVSKMEERFVLPKSQVESFEKWNPEIPFIVNYVGLQKEFENSYNALKSRERSLENVDATIEVLKSLGSPRALDLLDSSAKKNVEETNNERRALIEKIQELNRSCLLFHNQDMKSEMELDIMWGSLGVETSSGYTERKKAYETASKIQEEKLTKHKREHKERDRLSAEMASLERRDHYSKARQKLEKINAIIKNPLNMDTYIIDEKDFPTQFIVPSNSGILSTYLSKEISEVLPSDTEINGTRKSVIYTINGENSLDDIINGIKLISEDTRKLANLGINTKIVGKQIA